jgi:hypothetical protein
MVRKPSATLVSSAVTPLYYLGYFVFAAFASAFMLKVSCPFYHRIVADLSDVPHSVASTPRMLEIHRARARSRDLPSHRAPH